MSILDVERVAEGFVKPDPSFEVEPADPFGVEKRGRDRYQAVAADDALIGKTMGASDLHLRADSADRPCDVCASDGGEHDDRRVTGEDADRPPASRWSEVGPDDVAALYHSGAVSEAKRAAAATIAGSCGTRL